MMKLSTCAISVLAILASSSLAAKDYVLTDTTANIQTSQWHVANQDLGLAKAPAFHVELTTLHGGKQEGSQLIRITTPKLEVALIPTRGMDIYEVRSNGTRFGWKNPVDEIVNPAYMNLEMHNGLGWLDGFNEMMVRCGYEWTGHAGEENGVMYSLHGRAGNTPASKVVVTIDEKAPYAIHVKGLIKEHTFKFSALETWTEATIVPGDNTLTIHDQLTNDSDYPKDYQIIYHSNFGMPVLEKGAKFVTAAKSIAPFNDYAVKGLDDWQTYLGPTKDFGEMVFNLVPNTDSKGHSLAMMHNRAGTQGVAIGFNTKQLPYLTVWKNTDTVKTGYVTGMEPGTNYAYTRAIERSQGRIRHLEPNSSTTFDLEYHFLTNKSEVNQIATQIQKIQGSQKTDVIRTPTAKE